jgi:hypothetical protein
MWRWLLLQQLGCKHEEIKNAGCPAFFDSGPGYLPRKKEINTPNPPTNPNVNINRPRGIRVISVGSSASKSGSEIGAGGVKVARRVGV